jgi:hypothetical protein
LTQIAEKIDPHQIKVYHKVCENLYGSDRNDKEWANTHDTRKSKGWQEQHAIGNELGISKNTARKYREPQVQSEVQAKSSSKLDAFKEEIHLMMSQGIFNCVVMLERLHEKGYTGGMTILKDYVHP